MAVKAKKKRATPGLVKISEQMKEFSAMLGGELATWPKVTVKPMFGMSALYRGKQIFAALPKTRALTFPDAIMFKHQKRTPAVERRLKADPRIDASDLGPSGWVSFRMSRREDIRGALEWLGEAYEAAKK